jgi:hypothetical protein
MQIQITHVSQFRDEFHRAGRRNQFSYDGLAILFDWLNENYPDYDLDVVQLCCDYAESTPDQLAEAYPIDGDVIEYVNHNSIVLGVTPSTGNVVYAQF